MITLLMATAATSSTVSPATSKMERQVLVNMGLLRLTAQPSEPAAAASSA